MVVRTRYAPSPTGFMHIGNLKTALVEYLIAKSQGGKFILRIEDTDQKRFVEGATSAIYKTMKIVGLKHDEGPDIDGGYGPYIQSERKGIYLEYAKKLIDIGQAYYCFCTKERLETLTKEDAEGAIQYDRHCTGLSKEEIDNNINSGTPYVIRQLIPKGITTVHDEVFGDITVDNNELDDQILIKSDGLPTYNFANVVDDHLMEITHVVRGSEYLSSAPKYNLLYDAFGWETPKYVHTTLLLNANGEKLSKRKGDANFEDLMKMGFLPEAIVNYVALLGWSPQNNCEMFTIDELCEIFDIKGMSKSPSTFDMNKLTWFNSEYIKKMDSNKYFTLAKPYLEKAVATKGIDMHKLAEITQSRVNFIYECASLVDFIDNLPDYDNSLYVHKKMKTNEEISLISLKKVLPLIDSIKDMDWDNDCLYAALCSLAAQEGLKNGQILWPIRTALSGKPTTPCGASEIMELLGKEETIRRIMYGIEKLS